VCPAVLTLAAGIGWAEPPDPCPAASGEGLARSGCSTCLGDLAAARSYAQQSVDAAAHSHSRGRVHRLATLATILAGQGDADADAGTAAVMLDQAAGMESRRLHNRILAVRDAVTSASDGRAAAELAERVADVARIPVRQR